ncbi:FCD domain-containing protein [Solirubrobacter ginsenosidimutans]|uniref:FCD domain-containing protein n=1 Tax=Solirubrobacter ginsenosidimutans TaxID=490573 RepID=A0A9X3S470_9ACTN|nr:FCD domain-containing protein [Solirubrobacter ginsenosidimutans]MDA0166425.1 FCD domain-containing protein [Solirubrobacter ginsenosidimutans]
MEAGFEPIGPRRAFEGAVEQIAQRIRHGDLGEGDRLPSERQLAEAMRISRPTLREAVKVLSKAGVLEVHPGATGGIFVASGYVPIELLRQQSDVRLAEVAGVLEARRLLEPQVARFAAENASEADFERMQMTIEAHKQMLRSGEVLEREDRFLQLDMQFHVRMAEATGNATVVGLMRSLLRRLEIGRDLALRQPPIPEWVVDIHERTLAALRSCDDAAIAAVMDEHLGGMERAWEQETGRKLRLLG